jgi:hypothetical protein
MSDRYNQLDIYDYLGAVPPRCDRPKAPKHPVEISTDDQMHPNFSVGDKLTIQVTVERGMVEERQLTIIAVLPHNYYRLEDTKGYECTVHEELLEKVRVHPAIQAPLPREAPPEQVEHPIETPTEKAMYPNFSVGDEVETIHTLDRPDINWIAATVHSVLNENWLEVKFPNGGVQIVKSKDTRKVRLHQPVNLTNEDTALDHKAPVYHYEIKIIKGRSYKYMRWWDGSRHKSKYIGRA